MVLTRNLLHFLPFNFSFFIRLFHYSPDVFNSLVEHFLFIFQFAVVLVTNFSDTFSQSWLLLCNLCKTTFRCLKVFSKLPVFVFERLVLRHIRVSLFPHVFVLAFQNIDSLLENVLIKIHFLGHFLNYSLWIFRLSHIFWLFSIDEDILFL